MIKLDLQLFANEELLGTWTFNDVITPLDAFQYEDEKANITFTADGTADTYDSMVMLNYNLFYYKNTDATPTYSYRNNTWEQGKKYKTITITNDNLLVNKDTFVKWINANATRKNDVILTSSLDKPNDEIYPTTKTNLLLNNQYTTPFIAKTDEDKQVAVDENGNLWYKGASGGSTLYHHLVRLWDTEKKKIFNIEIINSNNVVSKTMLELFGEIISIGYNQYVPTKQCILLNTELVNGTGLNVFPIGIRFKRNNEMIIETVEISNQNVTYKSFYYNINNDSGYIIADVITSL